MKNTRDTSLFIITIALALIGCLIMKYVFGLTGINSLILTHVIIGGLAFLIGGVTLFSKKGSQLHKLTGKVFYISMVVSVSITLVVSLFPSHESPTLFHIGVLSLYFLIGGKRSINFKKPNHRLLVDRILAYSVVAVSLAIMLYTTLVDNYISPLRIVFGVTGLGFGLLDLVLFRNSQNIKKKWLILHLSKMLGGYTAAVTAFLVAQNLLLGYFNWFVPTVFGLSYLNFWLFKLKTFKPVSI